MSLKHCERKRDDPSQRELPIEFTSIMFRLVRENDCRTLFSPPPRWRARQYSPPMGRVGK